jgi:hypothetical protein
MSDRRLPSQRQLTQDQKEVLFSSLYPRKSHKKLIVQHSLPQLANKYETLQFCSFIL